LKHFFHIIFFSIFLCPDNRTNLYQCVGLSSC
jgi:hypothetical protein